MDDDFQGPIPTLPQLLRQLNNSLGWRPADMAKFMRKDPGEISRLLNGRIKPQDMTLEQLAEKYREAGLEGVTVELLKAARDLGGRVESTPYDIPAHWLRLIQYVLTFDQDFQDTIYRLWSGMLNDISRLSFRGPPRKLPTPPDDELDAVE